MRTHYLGRQTSARLKFVHKTVLEMKANFSTLTLYKTAVSVCITCLNVKKKKTLHSAHRKFCWLLYCSQNNRQFFP